MDSMFVRWSRGRMLEWFGSLGDDDLEFCWRTCRDMMERTTQKENFVCRSCSSWVPGIECSEGKSYKDCEKELAARQAGGGMP